MIARSCLYLTLSCCLLCITTGTSSAADWLQFRGPTGQGTTAASNLPVQWTATSNVQWKQAIPGKGWSSPILHGDQIYLTAAVAKSAEPKSDLALTTLALSQKTGQVTWSTEVFLAKGEASPKIHGKNSPASPTPIINEGRLYVHFGHQGTACLDLDGKVLWRNEQLTYKPVHGNGGSPVLHKGKLIFSIDGAQQAGVVALNATDGKVAWRMDRKSTAPRKFSFTTPAVITVNGQDQLISPGSNVVHALDPADGTIIWKVIYDGYSVIPRPVYGNGMVYVCTGYNTPSCLAIRPTGKGDVTDTHVAWRATKGIPHTASLMLLDKELYMVSDRGIASCLDALTGKPHWQQRIGSAYSASPIYSEGKIYFLSEDGITTIIRRGIEYQKLGTSPLGERTLASSAPSTDSLFIRSEEHLFRIGK
ncbi:MAG: PQQ-binding-like beta-propeller repeat protein [Planctomycetaceae bacterium]|nr:PQQ-binding-like beta-propeller repeat protein [Planctomycetaceae bacterium]